MKIFIPCCVVMDDMKIMKKYSTTNLHGLLKTYEQQKFSEDVIIAETLNYIINKGCYSLDERAGAPELCSLLRISIIIIKE